MEIMDSLTGPPAGYLYDNIDKKTGKHYVGIYTNGPSGKGPEFSKMNGVAEAIGQFITDDKKNFTVHFEPAGSSHELTLGPLASNGALLKNNQIPSFGVVTGNYQADLYILDGANPGRLPGRLMSGFSPGELNQSTMLAHELAEADATMAGMSEQQSQEAARQLENKVRLLQNPKGQTRVRHD